MKKPTNDDERLSALLDGQVSGPERDELLAHLAASDDDYEVFNDAAEILGALEEDGLHDPVVEEPATVIPVPQPRRPWRPPARWVALAAVLAGVLLISPLALRRGTPAGGNPVRLAAAVYTPGDTPPANLGGPRPWSAVRGGEVAARDPVQAARAGAMLLELAVAVRARNTATTKLLASQISERFQPGVGGDTPLRQIAERPDAPPEVLEPLLERATESLADALGSDYLHLGAWTRAAAVAAAARDAAFFSARSSRDMLRRAEEFTRADDAAREAVEGVRAAIPPQGEPAWPALGSALDTLLKVITD